MGKGCLQGALTHLIVMRHDEYSSNGQHVFHQLCMLGRTGCSTVDPVVQQVPGTQQQSVPHHKQRLAELERVIPGKFLQELVLFLLSKLDVLREYFNAVVDTVGTNQQAHHGGHVTSTTPNIQEGYTWGGQTDMYGERPLIWTPEM